MSIKPWNSIEYYVSEQLPNFRYIHVYTNAYSDKYKFTKKKKLEVASIIQVYIYILIESVGRVAKEKKKNKKPHSNYLSFFEIVISNRHLILYKHQGLWLDSECAKINIFLWNVDIF